MARELALKEGLMVISQIDVLNSEKFGTHVVYIFSWIVSGERT